MAYGESNGHVTDNVVLVMTLVMTPIRLGPNEYLENRKQLKLIFSNNR